MKTRGFRKKKSSAPLILLTLRSCLLQLPENRIMVLTLRQICKETNKRLSRALFFFPEERVTGITLTRWIVGSNKNALCESSNVTVNWQGKKVHAEILAYSGKFNFCVFCVVLSRTEYFLPVILHVREQCLGLFADDEDFLTIKDIEWCKRSLPDALESSIDIEGDCVEETPREKANQNPVPFRSTHLLLSLLLFLHIKRRPNHLTSRRIRIYPSWQNSSRGKWGGPLIEKQRGQKRKWMVKRSKSVR